MKNILQRKCSFRGATAKRHFKKGVFDMFDVWCLVFCPFHPYSDYSFTEGHEVPTHPLCKTWSGPATGMVPYSGWWWGCGMPWAQSSQGMIVDDKCLWNVAFYSRSRKAVLFLDCFWRTCFFFILFWRWWSNSLCWDAMNLLPSWWQCNLLPARFTSRHASEKRANASESPKVTVWQSEERER